MGFWQNLAESYEKNADALKITHPLSTTSISNSTDIIAIIVIDGSGHFIKADKIKKVKEDKKHKGKYIEPPVAVVIPVTEKSMGRSSGIAPHPVFDQYEYLKGHGDKFDAYIETLKAFADSEFATPQVKAIYNYMAKKSVERDLSGIDVKDKTNVIFEVEIAGESLTKVWKDALFFDAWHNYYHSQKETVKRLDYFTGTPQPIAVSHPKKISNSSANAKLISDNDSTNFTFRGKFQNSEQACSIGYESSQKAHQFLRYLIDDRGFSCGEQVIISYTIGETTKTLSPSKNTKEALDEFAELAPTDAEVLDKAAALRAETGQDYSDALHKALRSYNDKSKALRQHKRTAVIVLDAATTGRLSITFYRELAETDYLKQIDGWHSTCKWYFTYYDKDTARNIPYIGAPSTDSIIEAVYGKPRGGQDKSYEKIKKAARERLLRCIFDGKKLPFDYVAAAVRRVSNPMGITKDSKFDKNVFEQFLATTCALVRKFYSQQEYQLTMDHNRNDRDFLYGRLLGAADKLEQYANYKNQNDRAVTNALRYMSAFAQHPFRTWNMIHERLNPYMQTYKGIAFNEIQAIMQMFQNGDYENDSPLNGSYLLGYYLERARIKRLGDAHKQKKSNTNQEKENENDAHE